MNNITNLSPIDFEELCRDLAMAETGKRFSAFGPGPDGGIDGRHANSEEMVILQCKHYVGSSFSQLEASAKKELAKLNKLNPTRYLFFTSQSLSPKRSNRLAEIFSDFIVNKGDIWGLEDIQEALKRNPEIEKSHIKLWLSSAAILEKILHSGLEAFTHATKSEILEEVKVYAKNPSFDEAINKLEKEKILIISGSPGVGKTTLAKMVSYNYLREGWKFYAINGLEDGFARVDDELPTIFFFDDFLGRIELDRQSLIQKDTALSIFVKKIKKSKNSRFILTTRAHIFEEARLISDHVDDRRLQLAKYLLDVGSYTRTIKSHILFNHLSISELDKEHFYSLLKGNWLCKIIDHKNYNPRIIASVSSNNIDPITPSEYPRYIIKTLDNPSLIWKKPFISLSMKSQNLLISLFFSNQYVGEKIDTLRNNYTDLHRHISSYYSQGTKPNDFEDALHSLESGFISISGNLVKYINPSVRDFLKSHLVQSEFLNLLPMNCKRSDWAKNLWEHFKDIFKGQDKELRNFALKFSNFALIIEKSTIWRVEIKEDEKFYKLDDIALSERAKLLIGWWEHSKDNNFLKKTLELLQSNKIQLSPWRDSSSLPELYSSILNTLEDGHYFKLSLLDATENKFLEVLNQGIPVDQLEQVYKSFHLHMVGGVSNNIKLKVTQIVNYQFENTEEVISDVETEDDLTEYIDILLSLAKVTGRVSEKSVSIINEKISELEEVESEEQSTSYKPLHRKRDEKFSDESIKSLFTNLLNT